MDTQDAASPPSAWAATSSNVRLYPKAYGMTSGAEQNPVRVKSGRALAGFRSRILYRRFFVSLAEEKSRYARFLRRAPTCIGYRDIRGTTTGASKLNAVPDTDDKGPGGRSELHLAFWARGQVKCQHRVFREILRLGRKRRGA